MAGNDDNEEEITLIALFVANLGASHFGYGSLVLAGYAFKLSIAAALASYGVFLSAAVTGMLIGFVLTLFMVHLCSPKDVSEVWFLPYFVLSPVIGTVVLNALYGCALSLLPMLVVGVLGTALVAALFYGSAYYDNKETCCVTNDARVSESCCSMHSSNASSHDAEPEDALEEREKRTASYG